VDVEEIASSTADSKADTNLKSTKTGKLESLRKKIHRNDATDQGYIKLNYYNLFWIFVLCSMFGLAVETLYHFAVFGGYESRAGLVWGPFSPIYGTGACLFTIFLNRVYDKNVVVIFLVAMAVGMALEFCTSWLMQYAFGVIAWDYSDTFGNIQGRTNVAFGMMWGMLGTIWVRVLLPLVLKIIHKIPFEWHITFTMALSIFLALDIAITLFAFQRYDQRENGVPASNFAETVCDDFFDNNFMQSRFENLSTIN
jgi:uncharacterized membrane protein